MSKANHGDKEDSGDNRILTESKLLVASGEFDLESIQFLNLADCDIEDLSAIESCTNLVRLDARRNEISILRPLRNLKLLTWLNLSGNRVANIDPLGSLESLVDLNLAGNLIGTFSRIECLKKATSLQKLRFSDTIEKLSNPICHNLAYEDTILQMFPDLLVLDGLRVKGRGSELFKLCKELDEQIQSERTFGPVEERVIPGAWLKPGYFSLPAPNMKEDLATTEFREILSECHKLNRSAKEHVLSMTKDGNK